MRGVVGRELERGDCAGVQVEGGDVWGRGVVVVVVVFRFDGGLRAVEDTKVAEFVAGKEEGF